MNIQEILTYLALALAIVFLYRKFFGKKKSKKIVAMMVVGVVNQFFCKFEK